MHTSSKPSSIQPSIPVPSLLFHFPSGHLVRKPQHTELDCCLAPHRIAATVDAETAQVTHCTHRIARELSNEPSIVLGGSKSREKQPFVVFASSCFGALVWALSRAFGVVGSVRTVFLRIYTRRLRLICCVRPERGSWEGTNEWSRRLGGVPCFGSLVWDGVWNLVSFLKLVSFVRLVFLMLLN